MVTVRAVLSIGQKGLIKNTMHTTMGQTRLTHLTIMSMESDILHGLDLTKVIHQFASRKARKMIL